MISPHVLHSTKNEMKGCGKVCGNCGKPNKEIETISLFNKFYSKAKRLCQTCGLNAKLAARRKDR